MGSTIPFNDWLSSSTLPRVTSSDVEDNILEFSSRLVGQSYRTLNANTKPLYGENDALIASS